MDLTTTPSTPEPLTPEVTMDAFTPIDLRVGKILTCVSVEGSDKLLELTVDLGALGTRRIFSGLAKSTYVTPSVMVGKHVAVFANLKPRKMRFGISEGMILAAGPDDESLTVVELNSSTSTPGDRIG